MIPPPRNLLVSYHYYAKYNLARFKHCRVIGDSGAFSAAKLGAAITTKELAGWAQQWRGVLTWVAALDVIGDVEATRRNWHEMVDVHGVQGVPTIHFGSDPALMDYYAQRGVDFLGLGGMVGKSSQKQMRWLVSCFRYARDHHPQMRFHGWGVTAETLLRLPFYSVDSSGWSSAYRYGRLTLRDPDTGRPVKIALDGRESYSPEVVAVLRHYGVTPSQIADSGPHNRRLLVKLSALSASVSEQQFRKLHRRNPITAPSWGVADGAAGPATHLVIGQCPNEREFATSLPGPHKHLAIADGVEGGIRYVDEVLSELSSEPGPHQHLTVNTGWQQSTASWDAGAKLKPHYDDTILTEMQTPAAGPHMHLVEGSSEHLGIVAAMTEQSDEGLSHE